MSKKSEGHSQSVALNVIRRLCSLLDLGGLLLSEAIIYLDCSSITCQSIPAWSAACLYLVIRMHQLPVSVTRVAAEVGQDPRLILKLFQQVAADCQQNPPAVDFSKYALQSMARMRQVKSATRVQVLKSYMKLITWLMNARPDLNVTKGWAAAVCQHAMRCCKVEVHPPDLAELFGIKGATLKDRTQDLMQLLSAAGSVLPSSILPDSPSYMSMPFGPPAPAHRMSHTEDDDIPETLQAMPGTAVRLSVEADNPSKDAAANLQQQQQAEPSASATLEEWAQTSAQIQEEYAKFPVLGMINLQDMPPNIKSQVLQLYVRLMAWLKKDTTMIGSYWAAAVLQHAMQHYKVPCLPSNLASHVKAEVLHSRARDVEQLLAAAANQWGCSLHVGIQCIEAMQGDTHTELLHKVMASEGFPKTADITLPEDAASSPQQTQGALLQPVAPAVPAVHLEASAAIADPLNQLVHSISGIMPESQTGTAALMAEAAGPDPNTAPGTQVLHPQPAATPPALPIAWPAVPEQASAPSRRLLDSGRVTHPAWTAPVVPESYEACKEGLGMAGPVSTCLRAPNAPAVTTPPHSQAATARQKPQAPPVLPQATLPFWSTTVAQALAASAGNPRPVANSVEAYPPVCSSEAPQQGLQKVQSCMLTSKPQSAGQAEGPKLQPVLHRLSHSSFQADPAHANLPDSIRPNAHMQSSEAPRSLSQLHTSRPQPAKAMPQLPAPGAQATMPALQALGSLQVTSHANIASSACPLPQPMHAAPSQPHGSLHRQLTPAQPLSAAACSPQLRWANGERFSLQGLHSSECNDLEPGEPSLPKQTWQQSLPVLQGPATQQLHKLLLQLEATAQSSAMLTGGVLEAPYRGQQPLRSEQDGLPASWVRTEHDPEPTPCGQLMPQQQAASSGLCAGAMSLNQGVVASEPQEGLSPWCLLPGPLHAAIATAMAHEGALPNTGVPPSTAIRPHAGEPARARGKGIKRPRAESGPRAASALRPSQNASSVAAVNSSTTDRSASTLAAAGQPGHTVPTGSAAAAGRSNLLPKPGLGLEAKENAQHDASTNTTHAGRASSEQHVDSIVFVESTDTADSAVSPVLACKAVSAPQADSAAAASGSAVPAGSAEQADLVFQPSSIPEPTLEEMMVSQQALSVLQPQSLAGERDMRKSGSASPSQTSDALHPAGPEAKRQHVGATVGSRKPDSQLDHGSTECSTSGGHVDAVASRSLLSSQLQLINEHEAQDALLLLHDHNSQAASGQQQSTGHPERASASVGDAVIDPVEHDTNDGCVSRPPSFIDVDGNSDAYEVDRIVTHQSWQAGSYVRTKYLVRWKGYGPTYDTWQTKTSLRHAQEAIRDYHNSM